MEGSNSKTEYSRLNAHFQACLDLAESDRRSYLAKLADSDPELEKELRSLLEFHDDSTPSAVPERQPAAEREREQTRTRAKKSWASVATLIPVVGGAALILILGVQAWALARLERDLKEQMASNVKGAVGLRISNLRSWAAEQRQHAQKVLQDPVLAEAVSSLLAAVRETDSAEVTNARLTSHPSAPVVVERMSRASHEICERGFTVLSPSGLCLASDYGPLVGVSVSSAGAEYLGRMNLGETLISRPYPDRLYARNMASDPKKPVMFVAGPIRDASGRIVAVGAFRFNPTRLNEILSSANAEIVAFDSKGLALSSLAHGEELQAWGLSSAPEPALRTYLRDPGVDLTSGQHPQTPPESWPATVMCRSAIQGRDGVDADGHRDLRGRMVVAAWAWLPEWSMGVGGQVPVAQVLAPAAPVRTAFTTLAVVFAALTAGLFASTRFFRILRRKAGDTLFGGYLMERPIGKGGMAEVFLARHAYLKRPAALKILNQPDPDAAAVERFEREARLASTLAHPNTIQVFDFGETPDGRLYYAMEYVRGLTLAQFLALEGPPSIGRAVHLLRQIAGSLGEAHQVDLLHRDLKPSNIMVTARGGLADVVKVLDFGIACSVTPGTDDHTRSASLIGTPAFLAPERIRTPQILDPRSDIYSFGAVAFHLLTGRHVFEGSTPTELIYQVLTAPRPSPSRLRGGALPAPLEKLILVCLSIEPQQRPSSTGEIEAVLAAVAELEPWTQVQAFEWWAANRERVESFIQASQ